MPDRHAFGGEAERMECLLKISTSTPASFNISFIHLETAELWTSTWGFTQLGSN